MKILVTGGAGFIGSAVIRHIIRHSADSVVNLDKLTYAGNLESLAETSSSERYTFEQVDICDRTAVDLVFHDHQPAAVLLFAAESNVYCPIDGTDAFIETNFIGAYSLLKAARQYVQNLGNERMRAFRFHHIYNDGLYGNYVGIEDLFTQTNPNAPSSSCCASEASSDHLLRAWLGTYSLPTADRCTELYQHEGVHILHQPEHCLGVMSDNGHSQSAALSAGPRT